MKQFSYQKYYFLYLSFDTMYLSFTDVYLSFDNVYLPFNFVYLSFSYVYLPFSCVYLSFSYVYLPFGCVDLPNSHLIVCWLFSCVHLSFTQLCLSILHSIMACCLSITQYRSNIDWLLIPKQQKHPWIRQAGRTGHGAVPHKMAAAWRCVVKERFTRHLRLQRQQI